MVHANGIWRFLAVGILCCSLSALAQTASPSTTTATAVPQTIVPQLVSFAGKATDGDGKPISGIASIAFAIYSTQNEGAALWMETQNVTADARGNYSVQLGATTPEGLPLDLFVSGEARWLGVSINNGEEQPRVLLLSVPYALKAADAQTLGGLPASAFALAASPMSANGSAPATSHLERGISSASSNVTTTGGTANTIALFTTATNIQNSILTQTGTSTVNVNGILSATGAVNGSSYEIGSKLFASGSYANANAFLGFAGNTTTTGTFNTASGYAALAANTTAAGNTASGYRALNSNTTGGYNTANGYAALASNTTAEENTATGIEALTSNTTGAYNTASGSYALVDNTIGAQNTATGMDALYSNSSGSDNTATGVTSLVSNTTGNSNTACGTSALFSNTTGSLNTATGVSALFSNTTGSYNTANGYTALYFSTGSPNEAFGLGALFSNTTGTSGQAFGYQALYSNTTGNGNQAFGYRTMYGNTTGADNAAFGGEALYANTSGTENTAVGGSALYSNSTGSYNTAVGQAALVGNTTGDMLTCVGFSCTTSDAISNATAIGAHARVEQSNSLVLGGSGDYAVNVGIGTTKPSNILTVARGAGHPVSDSWETYSSRRWKTNIKTLPDALSKVEQLRGVSYDLKDSGKHEIGVIAEEVGKVVPEVVSYENNGKDASGVDYSRLTALLIEAVKQQQALMATQQKQIALQQTEILKQQKLAKAQQQQITDLRQLASTQQTKIARLSGKVGALESTVRNAHEVTGTTLASR
jgi:hypothetical protein